MESLIDVIITSSNYFQWKSCMENLLRSKGLYRITLGTKVVPTNASKKDKWDNKNDLAHGLIGISISIDL